MNAQVTTNNTRMFALTVLSAERDALYSRRATLEAARNRRIDDGTLTDELETTIDTQILACSLMLTALDTEINERCDDIHRAHLADIAEHHGVDADTDC